MMPSLLMFMPSTSCKRNSILIPQTKVPSTNTHLMRKAIMVSGLTVILVLTSKHRHKHKGHMHRWGQPWYKHKRERKNIKTLSFSSQLCTCISLFCTFLCRFCANSTWNCLILLFREDVNKRRRDFILFPNLNMVLRNSSPGGFAYIWQNKWDGIIALKTDANSFLKRRFCCHHFVPSWSLCYEDEDGIQCSKLTFGSGLPQDQ